MEGKQLYLFDIDGTLTLGESWLAGGKELLQAISDCHDKDFVFITNNSTKSVADYLVKFEKLGFPVKESQIMTAGLATCYYMKEYHSQRKIFVVGTESFTQELVRFGLTVVTELEEADCLLVGYDNTLTYEKLVNASTLLNTGELLYIATNLDMVCPYQHGFIPDCGAICKMLEHGTGKQPTYIGKPYDYMIDIILGERKILKENCLVIGDRMYTDILCGINAGIETAVVFTGEANSQNIGEFDYKPSYIYDSVLDLLTKEKFN